MTYEVTVRKTIEEAHIVEAENADEAREKGMRMASEDNVINILEATAEAV